MRCSLRILRAGVALAAIQAAINFAGPAHAQDAPSATAPAAADGGVADIVVTATRREESLQKVPIAITALSNDRLVQSNVTDLKNVALLSPGIQVQPQFVPGNAIFQIRGQVQSDTAPTIDPSVGVYFDDVYIARSAGSLVNLVDLARVEVLKGPQGTLFGKNTTGGAIRLVSNRPTREFEGYVDASYESFQRLKLEGVVNVPLSDIAAFRFAGQIVDKSGGYATNSVTGNPIDTDKTYFGRGSLLVEPGDGLTILLQGDYTHTRAGGLPAYLKNYEVANGPFTALSIAVENGLWDFNPATAPAAIGAGAALLNGMTSTARQARRTGSDLRDVTADSYTYNFATGRLAFVGGESDPRSFAEIWGAAANISYDFGGATLRSITSYRHTDYKTSYDIDGLAAFILDSEQIVRSKQFSQELLLNGSTFEDRLNWTVGGLYFNEKPSSSDEAIPLGALSALSGGRGTITIANARNKSWGAFAQGTFKLTEALSVTGGVRYSRDDRSFVATAFNQATDGSTSCIYTVANGLATLPNFSAPCSISQSKKFSQWSYAASVNYQIDPSKLIYVRTGRGYRAGGFNPRINAPEVVSSFKPETVTDYELGLKADWLDRTLRTNLAMFTSRGSDVQQTVNGISPTNGAAITSTQNIGKRLVKGVEAELVVRPMDFLTLDASVTYLHARSKNPLNPQVRWVQLTPAWTWNLGSSVDVPFSDDFAGRWRVDVSYRDTMHDSDPLRDPTGAILYTGEYRAVTLVSSRFTVHHQPSGVDFAIYGRNLTNEHYEARQTAINGLGLTIANLAEPRVIGVEMKIPFGAKAGR